MKKIVAAIVGATLLQAAVAFAEKSYGNIEGAHYVSNYDGDTLTFDIAGYPPIIGDRIGVRVFGIDTPEIKGKCQKEKALAQAAKAFVHGKLEGAADVSLHNVMRDKYFRVLADVVVGGQSLSGMLIEAGYAVPYDGGTKTKNWCE